MPDFMVSKMQRARGLPLGAFGRKLQFVHKGTREVSADPIQSTLRASQCSPVNALWKQ